MNRLAALADILGAHARQMRIRADELLAHAEALREEARHD